MQTDNNKSLPLRLTAVSMDDLVDHVEQLEALDWSDFPRFENKTRTQTRRLLIQLCWVWFLYDDSWN